MSPVTEACWLAHCGEPSGHFEYAQLMLYSEKSDVEGQEPGESEPGMEGNVEGQESLPDGVLHKGQKWQRPRELTK